VNEIELAFRQRVGDHVMLEDFQVGVAQLLEGLSPDIGYYHPPAGADPFTQPRGDGSAAASYLEAMPAAANAESSEAADGSGIE